MVSDRNLTSQTFGRWTVLDSYEKTKKGEKKWLCRCQCGTGNLTSQCQQQGCCKFSYLR